MSDANNIPQRMLRFPYIVSAILTLIVIYFIWVCLLFPVSPTTVYILRHAEKAAGPQNDPPLTPAGTARAQTLAHVMTAVDLDGIYASQAQRTQLTAQPTATAKGLSIQIYQALDTASVTQTVLASHRGKTSMIVGHSNTVDDIMRDLGASNPPIIDDTKFDRLFILHLLGHGVVHLDELRYGAPTP